MEDQCSGGDEHLEPLAADSGVVATADIVLAAMDGISWISLRQRTLGASSHRLAQPRPRDPASRDGAVATHVVTLVTAPAGTRVDQGAVGFPLASA